MTGAAPARTAEEARQEILAAVDPVIRRKVRRRVRRAQHALAEILESCSISERERLIALFWKG